MWVGALTRKVCALAETFQYKNHDFSGSFAQELCMKLKPVRTVIFGPSCVVLGQHDFIMLYFVYTWQTKSGTFLA